LCAHLSLPARRGIPVGGLITEMFASEEVAKRVVSVIAATQKLSPEEISLDSTLDELRIDSLDGINMLFALEEEFRITIPQAAYKSLTIREVIEGIEKLLREKSSAPKRKPYSPSGKIPRRKR
jgi:acyl carrier protein